MSFGLIDAFLGINIQILCFEYVKSAFCYHFARIILNFLSFLNYFY